MIKLLTNNNEKVLIVIVLFLLIGCLPTFTPEPTATARVLRGLDFIPIFILNGRGNTVITFETIGTDTIIGFTEVDRVRLLQDGELIAELTEDIVIGPAIYEVHIETSDIWVMLFGATDETRLPTIIVTEIEP